ncbi:MAG: nucleotidyltransferase family protein [bacterium]
MKILGIIAEYNPLHNGHIHHLNEAMKIKPDLVIAVITSTFNSRGEISLLSSKEKTSLLLNNNVDIIVELPFILGVQSADLFAYHSVKVLNNFNVTNIVSGSEDNNIDYIKQLDTTSKSKEYNNLIANYLKDGLSYKQSSNKAFETLGITIPNSNDMLNWKYYSSIQDINSNIELSFVKREKSNYLDKSQNDNTICSATSIRETKNYVNYVPSSVKEILDTKGILTHDNLDKYLVYKRDSSTKLNDIYFMDEGLDNAFLKSNELSFNNIASELTSTRYTTSRIRRALLQILFNITKDEANSSLKEFYPRVIGFNTKGQSYLNSIKKEKEFFTNLKSNINTTYDIEIRILKTLSNIYGIDYFKENQLLPIIKK